jgi:uncharacterized protein (DUF1501 family)
MKRRSFLKYTGITSASVLVPGFLKAFEADVFSSLGKRLVIVQLSGGNDGLNTCVPFSNNLYYSARPKLAIPRNEILRLNDDFGFHPAFGGLRQLFDESELAVYHGVGYPNPDRSHFRSTDIWHTASDSNEYLNTGWLGRLLDANCPGSEHPWYAIEVDDTLSLAMKGKEKSGFAVKNAKKLQQITRDPMIESLAVPAYASHDSEREFLYKTLISTRNGAAYIAEKANLKAEGGNYPQHEFGQSLKQISAFIVNGMQSGIYYTGLSGFDTHVRQAESQQRLLKIVNDSLFQFRNELKKAGEWNNTIVMVFSEFGRRVKQNASNGTDHGTANQVYLLGGALKKAGFRNQAVSLDNLDDGDLRHHLDFRTIYGSLLDGFMNFDSESVLGRKFERLDFI